MDCKLFTDILFESYRDIFDNIENLDISHPDILITNSIFKNYFFTDFILENYCRVYEMETASLSSLGDKGALYWSTMDPKEIDIPNLSSSDKREFAKILNKAKEKCSYSKSTIYSQAKKGYFNDLELNNYAFTLPGNFLSRIKRNVDGSKSSPKFPSIYTYNQTLSGTIISHWKSMPFNARHLANDPYYDTKIKSQDFATYFSLPLIGCFDQCYDNSIDDIVCYYLTDHFFNVYLFSQFVLLMGHNGIDLDSYYSKQVDSSSKTLVPLFKKLQSLPTMCLKDYCFRLFREFLSTIPSDKSSVLKYLNQLCFEIDIFSNVYSNLENLCFKTFCDKYISKTNYTDNNIAKYSTYELFYKIMNENKAYLKQIILEHRHYYLDSRPEIISASSLILNCATYDELLLNALSIDFFR